MPQHNFQSSKYFSIHVGYRKSHYRLFETMNESVTSSHKLLLFNKRYLIDLIISFELAEKEQLFVIRSISKALVISKLFHF